MMNVRGKFLTALLGAALLLGTSFAPEKGRVVYAQAEASASEEENSASQTAYVSENVSTPRLIVTGFSTEPAEVKAGTDFKLIIHLKNTSKQTALQNLLFDLEAPTEGSDSSTASPAFLPASGSNSIYLESIAKNGSCDISIVLNAKSDLTQKPYSISIGMKYENSDAVQFESTASISIPIKQDARIEFSQLELSSSSIEMGDDANLTCSLYNLGKTKLYNVKVNFEGSGLSSSQLFLGNIDSGSTASIDAMITGASQSEGEEAAKMIVTYEDEEGNVSTLEQTFTLTVTAPSQEAEETFEYAEEEAEEGFHLPWILIVLILILIAAGCILVLKKKKRKKMEQEEEDLIHEFDRLTKDE